MIPHRVQDWDDAYANAKNIAGGALESLPANISVGPAYSHPA